jgi:transcriptional regulator NrdR family protein
MKAPKFPCQSCGGRTLVVDSRDIHRRRRCVACGADTYTREITYKHEKPTTSSLSPVQKPHP